MRIAVIRPATAVVLLLLSASLGTAAAQPAGKVPWVGYLTAGSHADQGRQRRFDAFRQGLRDLGYAEGQNIAIESRWAEGKDDRYPTLAADLVRLKVDVIVAVGGAASKAAQQATRTIPIVMSLREMVPKASRVALLRNPTNPASAAQLREAEAAARALGVRLQTLEARVPQEIDRAFAAMTRERAGALLVLTDSIFTNQRRQIAELAAERRLPAVYGNSEHAEAGGLVAYSASFLDLERRAATFVDKILRGAKPGDLPVEQPTKLELVINLRTAKAIGLTIPPSLLQRADQIID